MVKHLEKTDDACSVNSNCACWPRRHKICCAILLASCLAITLTGLGRQVLPISSVFRATKVRRPRQVPSSLHARGALHAPDALHARGALHAPGAVRDADEKDQPGVPQCVDVGACDDSLIHSQCQDINEAWDGKFGDEPAIYNNSTKSWRAFHEWQQHLFIHNFSTHRLPLGTFRRDLWMRLSDTNMRVSSERVELSFEEYLQIAAKHQGNAFLFARVSPKAYEGIQLASTSKRRASFFRDLAPGYTPPNNTEKLFKVFAFDGRSTGHGMHFHGVAWIAQIFGRKLWFLAPPSDESAETSEEQKPGFPYANLSEIEGGCPCTWLIQRHLVPGRPVKTCLQKPGQLLTVPHRWWHSTCSLDEYNIAVGGQLDA